MAVIWKEIAYKDDLKQKRVNLVIDGGGSVIATGIKLDAAFPACVIQEARVLADQSGSIAISLWKDSYSNFPPTVADLIDTFSISSAVKSEETGLSISVSAGDIIRFNVDSCTTITRATLELLISLT